VVIIAHPTVASLTARSSVAATFAETADSITERQDESAEAETASGNRQLHQQLGQGTVR
jgi:hypothetical protein